MNSNSASVEFYKSIASNISDAKDVKLLPTNDNTHYDIELIKKFSGSNLIDLGSGTGLIVNNLIDDFEQITAVELFKEFSQYIISDKNITVVHENLLTFTSKDRYDLSTMFGVAHYFNSDESLKIYNNVFNLLNEGAVFILKNQFGVESTKQ